ncbi:MAG TPA: GtrA family protein [Clostridiales bacterium]|nr:GtrA family protein [Clostridiales bacterium]
MDEKKTCETPAEKPEEVTAHSFRQIFSSRQYFAATVKQFLKFGFVGIINTAISFAVVYICLGQGISIYIGNTLGWACGVVNAYFWNMYWVFKGNREGFKKTIPKFFGSYFLTFLLSQGLTYIFKESLGMNQYLVPVVCVLITTFINFFLSKFWTFKK